MARPRALADTGRAHPRLVEPGDPVALDQDRPLRPDGDIPADVRHFGDPARGLADQRQRLVPERNLEVHDRLLRFGVHVVAALVLARVAGADRVAVVVEHREEAAPGELVAHRAAPELLHHHHRVDGLAVEVGRDACRVDGPRAVGREIGVLHDRLLDQDLTLPQQLGAERIPVRHLGGVVAEHALALAAHRNLRDDHRVAPGEVLQRGGVGGVELHPFAPEEVLERAVEVELVLERLRDLAVVHRGGEVVLDEGGHERLALATVQQREVGLVVIDVGGVVERRPPQHVDEHERSELALLLTDLTRERPDAGGAECGDALEEVGGARLRGDVHRQADRFLVRRSVAARTNVRRSASEVPIIRGRPPRARAADARWRCVSVSRCHRGLCASGTCCSELDA